MGTRVSVEKIASENLFVRCLPPVTQRAFLYCIELPLFSKSGWYLAGGTALALQVGHRQSVDLDFFSQRKSFEENDLKQELVATGKWETTLERKNTIYGKLMDAKMSFIAYPFFIPSAHQLQCGTIRILTVADIATMKIIAISQRGRKRDFVDLYWYCSNREESLTDIIKRAVKQYPGQKHNLPHFLKSLTYFDDAENDPMPRLFFKATWPKIKKFFQTEVKKTARELLKLK